MVVVFLVVVFFAAVVGFLVVVVDFLAVVVVYEVPFESMKYRKEK